MVLPFYWIGGLNVNILQEDFAMKIYLVQHGKAVSPEIDPEKPLSPEGRKEIEELAKFFAHKSFPLFTILHSNKARSKQTAEILGEHLEPELKLEEHAHLGPNDPIDSIFTRIEAEDQDLMIVGHLPFLDRLIGQLIAGHEDLSIVHFAFGKVVCLLEDDGRYSIDWVVGYDQI